MELNNKISERSYKQVFAEDGHIIKLFAPKYSKSAIFNEALNQTRLEASSLNVPKIISVQEINGQWAIISQQIIGKTLAQLIASDDVNEAHWVTLFVDLLIEIQKQEVEFLNPLNDKLIQKIARSPLKPTMRMSLINDFKMWPHKKQVVHGDYNPENIILDEHGQIWIFDWAHVTEGDGLYDAAKSYLWLNIHQQPDFATAFIHEYCEKSGTSIDTINIWLPVVAASIVATAISEKSKSYLMSVINNRHPEVK